MPLLPAVSIPRRYADGGALSLDPNDASLARLDPVAKQKEILRRQALSQSQGSEAGTQVGQGVQQVASLASTLGATGGAGLAGVASAAGPVGAAIAAGAAVGGAIRKSNLEDDGLRSTTTGGQLKESLANTFDPIGNAVNVWGNSKLNVGQKVASTLAPWAGSFFTKSLVEEERRKQREKVMGTAIDQAGKQSQSVYGGLAESVRRGQYRRGGLLPLAVKRRFAVGGELPGEPPSSAPPTRYTVKNPSPQAQLYYQNALPTMKRLIGQKHDEVYNDPATGKQCTANSCLSFAGTVLEQATGTKFERTKGNLYNPEFTRTSERQGWVRVPLNQTQIGDRLQRWEGAEDYAAANPGSKTSDFQDVVQNRTADLADRRYIEGKSPAHMMVLSSGLQSLGEGKPYYGQVVQDGHQFANADRAGLNDISDKSYVAYRYIGVNGQPTNNPTQAVAPNPANPAASKPVATRAKGGLLPGKPSQIMRQDATAPGNIYRGSAPAQDAPESLTMRGMRKMLPINAAMYLQDLTGNKTPLTERDLTSREKNSLRYAARDAGTMQHSSITYLNYPQREGQPTLRERLTVPTLKMQSTVGGAMLSKKEADTHVRDSYDFAGNGEQEYKDISQTYGNNTRKALTDKNTSFYQKAAYVGRTFGSSVDGKGIPVDINIGNLKRPRAGEFKTGGLLPKSVIAHGALHSEKNQHVGHATAGKRGIPVLAADGTKLAEVERDELTLSDTATQKLEKLRTQGNLHGLGKHLQRELLTNTIPSPRYAKRLTPAR